MEFSVAKYYVMYFGPSTASDIYMSVSDEVHLLRIAQTVRDLEVSFTSDLKSSVKTDSLVARAGGI